MWFWSALFIGIIVGMFAQIGKDEALKNSCSSKDEYQSKKDAILKERIRKRKAYWDGPMNRRDWFWWGRR